MTGPWSLGAVFAELDAAGDRCEVCRNYAWCAPMVPVAAGGTKHHPSCSTLRNGPPLTNNATGAIASWCAIASWPDVQRPR